MEREFQIEFVPESNPPNLRICTTNKYPVHHRAGMNHNARFRDIRGMKELGEEFRDIGAANAGAEIMVRKFPLFIRLEGLDVRGANILKQEALARGCEAALTYGAVDFSAMETDVLLMGTVSGLESLAEKLQNQPFGLSDASEEISGLLSVFIEGVCGIILRDGSFLPSNRTRIMGVLNVTPDSFSDGGKYTNRERAIAHGIEMIREGADIIDVGGESTRPFSSSVSVEEELRRVIPVIEGLKEALEKEENIGGEKRVLISVDTRKLEVAKAALNAGAEMLNDINALRAEGMADLAASFEIPVVLMHMLGTPENMQRNPVYKDVVGEIIAFLRERKAFALEHGIERERIVLDPGIGFGKTTEHNLLIIKRLWEFTSIGQPILVGTSNKSFIGNTLSLPVEDRLEGTLATVALSVWNRASIVRVHNVKASRRVVLMTEAMRDAGLKDA